MADSAAAATLTGVTEVDELGVLLVQLSALKETEHKIKAKLIAYEHAVLEGALFRVTVNQHLTETLDGQAVRREMGDAWFGAHCKVGIRTVVRCAAKVSG